MFPGREEVPKTLIFAKTDSHANDIIDIFSTEGAKIYKYMQKNYEPGNSFPQAYYFKNNKILVMSGVSNLKEDYNDFIKQINNK